MRAAVLTEFGPPDVLQLREVAKPRPGDGDVLVRVHAEPIARSPYLSASLLR